MNLVDRLEKLGRLILWLSLAVFAVMVPIALRAQERQTAMVAERVHADAERVRLDAEKEKAASLARLPIESMGAAFSGLDGRSASVWFSNVSTRAGFVCLHAKATNPNTKAVVTSLPTCQEIHPYASNVNVKMMFAGGDFDPVCGKDVHCALSVNDVP